MLRVLNGKSQPLKKVKISLNLFQKITLCLNHSSMNLTNKIHVLTECSKLYAYC